MTNEELTLHVLKTGRIRVGFTISQTPMEHGVSIARRIKSTSKRNNQPMDVPMFNLYLEDKQTNFAMTGTGPDAELTASILALLWNQLHLEIEKQNADLQL